MGAVKSALETYSDLELLRAMLLENDRLPDVQVFKRTIRGIFREWSLDPSEISEEAGLSMEIVQNLLVEKETLPKALKVPGIDDFSVLDARKLVDALMSHFNVEGKGRQKQQDDFFKGGANYGYIKGLSRGAKIYFEVGALSVRELEELLCNISSENQVPVLSYLSDAIQKISFNIPLSGEADVDSLELMREISSLQAKVQMLKEERDRLYELLRSKESSLKTGFLNHLGAAPVMAVASFLGSIFGAEEATALIEFVNVYLQCTVD